MNLTIGRSVARLDSREKVTGKGVYVADMRLPGMLVAKVLRSPVPHARIKRIDSAAAASLTGVCAVMTRENLPVKYPYYGSYVKDQAVVAFDTVRYEGDVVAAVAAVDDAVVDEALKRVHVEYEELAWVTTVEEALKPGAPLIHANLRRKKEPVYGRGGSHVTHPSSNICLHFRYARGDFEKGLTDADYVFEDTFEFPSAQHYPMESHVSVANFDGDRLTVWTCTQTPFPLRQELSNVFGIPLTAVRVIVPYVGGGYGAKSGIRTEALAAGLSRIARRPVRLAFSPEEMFRTICQPRATVHIQTGLKKDGAFVTRKCELYFDLGAYANSGPAVTEKAGYRAHGPYRIPNVQTDSYGVYTNTVPGGAFRGFGGPHASFAYESHIDLIARRLNMDPVELRLRNLLRRGEEYAPGDRPVDCDLAFGLKRVADAIEWGKKDEALKPGFKRGKGLACAVKDGGGTNKPAHAMVKISADGSVLLSFGSVEMGQGIKTALVQVVGEELGVSVENVWVGQMDTEYTPYDRGTNASSAVSLMGRAVLQAAGDAREQLLRILARHFALREADVRLVGGQIQAGDKQMAFSEVTRLCLSESGGDVVGKGFFMVPASNDAALGYPSPFWELGVGGAEVEVDELTGTVKLIRYVSLTDAGKMINPLQCRGQDEGAAMFGIGLSLFEELNYEEGRLTNPNLVNYRLPRFRDLPSSFNTIILEEKGGPGPYGAKGMGEGGILAVVPAVCNAVHDAIGARIHSVPLKTEKVWRMIMDVSTSVIGAERESY